MKRLQVLLIAIFLHSMAFGQFSDSVHYYTKYASTGSLNKTDNSRAYLLSNSFNAGVQKKKFALTASGSWVYGETDRVLTNNDLSTALNFSLLRATRQIYYWGLSTYDRSFSLKINGRFQAGAGIAYNFVDSKTVYLSVSEGVVYDKSDLFMHDTMHYQYHTYRNSLRLAYKVVIAKIVTIDGAHYFQNAFDDVSDYIIRSNSNLSVKLYKWLNVTASFQYNKNSVTRSDNLILTYGLTLEKYF
jgi:hypothetical protein